MKFNVLKSEDIVFYGKDGNKIVNVESIDLDKLDHIEGLSPFSVLRLEHNGDTYLLTDEFHIEASFDVLEEFLEEYDEQDEEEYAPQTEQEIEEQELEDAEEVLVQEQMVDVDISIIKEEDKPLVDKVEKDKEHREEELKEEILIHFEPIEQVESEVKEIVSSDIKNEVEEELVGETSEGLDSIQVVESDSEEVEGEEELVIQQETNSIVQLQTDIKYIENSIEDNINVVHNNIIEDRTNDIQDDVEENNNNVQNNIEDSTNNVQDEEENSNDVQNNVEDNTNDVQDEEDNSNDVQNNVEDNTNDIQDEEDNQQDRDSALARVENASLEVGDLTTLGINNLTDSADNIARVNNILADSDVDIGTDTTALQNIVDVLIKVDAKDGDGTATDITQSEWELLGLNNVSAPDANELNIALADSDSLDLGTTPQTNLQIIEDSLNALDQVKYGNTTGVALSDLTNIGVTGVGGASEPTLEAVNAVLYDADVSADHTNSVQEVVDTLAVLNSANGDSNVLLTADDIETLGILVPLDDNPSNTISDDELTYINNRISENSGAESGGDGDFSNDVSELEALVLAVDEHNFYLGDDGANQLPYNVDVLYDGGDGVDSLTVEGGISVDLSNVHNIEGIILNVNNSNLDSDLSSALDELTVQDVIDITDGSNVLTIDENDGTANDTVERVYLDNNEFSTDGVLDVEGYYNYIANDGSGVTVRIQELIVVE